MVAGEVASQIAGGSRCAGRRPATPSETTTAMKNAITSPSVPCAYAAAGTAAPAIVTGMRGMCRPADAQSGGELVRAHPDGQADHADPEHADGEERREDQRRRG